MSLRVVIFICILSEALLLFFFISLEFIRGFYWLEPWVELSVLQCISIVARSQPPGVTPTLLNYRLQVHLQTCSIILCKCISNLARLRPPSLQDLGLQGYVQTRSITASTCISKLTWLQPPSSYDQSLQTCLITFSQCVSKFTQWLCGEMVKLHFRRPIINSQLHRSWHLKGIHEEERFWLEEGKRIWRNTQPWWPTQIAWIYEHLARVHEKPHKGCGSIKAWQESVAQRAGKDRVCISYNAMMSIYPGFPKYILPVVESISVIPVSSYVYI